MEHKSVLFVCSANACRSPLAAAMARQLADWNGLPLSVFSAGVHAAEGAPPFSDAVSCASRYFPTGIADHRAHRLHPLDVEQADLTVCISETMAWLLKNQCRGGNITAFSPSLSDPVGGGDTAYDACMEEITRQMAPLLCPLCERPFLVRPAFPADLSFAAALEADSFPHPYGQMDFLRGLYEKEKRLLVAENAERQLLGYVYAERIPDLPPAVEILTLAVTGQARRKGVGKALLSCLERAAAPDGCGRILLEVREGNAPARGLYEQSGFRLISRRRGYYDAPVEDALILEKSL